LKRVDTGDPARMEFRSGGGCATVFSVGLLLVGLAGATSPLWRESFPSHYLNVYLAVPIGILMALLGLIGVFVRMSVSIDGVDRSVISAWSALGMRRARRRSFDEFRSVRIEKHVRSSGSETRHRSTFTDYQVHLVAGDGTVMVGDYIGELAEARKLAEEVAGLVGVAVEDAIAGDQGGAEAEA
jgi:hypothetical protein